MTRPLRVFVLAGEASGDRLGGALMRGLKAEAGGPVVFAGVGGASMAAEGLESAFPIADIAVMGLAEVLPRLPTLIARLKMAEKALTAFQPDAVVTIDAPDFGLRVADRTRAASPDTTYIHYVAPTVWAWRPHRAEKLARRVDHLMALLPFEPPFFERVGLSCDFVGHPIVEAVAGVDPGDPARAAETRAELGIEPEAPLLVALPGSRRGEIERLAAPFGQAITELAARRPTLRVVAPLAETVADQARAAIADWPGRPVALDPRGLAFHEAETRKWRAMAAADAALAASGTVSLELAAMRTPMAIAYRANALTAAIVRRMLLVDTATLVNLITETRAVPEFIQERCDPMAIAEMLDRLLTQDAPEAAAQRAAAEDAMRQLGEGEAPPSTRAARSVLAAIERRRGRASAPPDGRV